MLLEIFIRAKRKYFLLATHARLPEHAAVQSGLLQMTLTSRLEGAFQNDHYHSTPNGIFTPSFI